MVAKIKIIFKRKEKKEDYVVKILYLYPKIRTK